MRKILMLLAAVSYPAAATADTWTVGQQPKVLPADRFPIVGDGSTTYGGRPPYFDTMPADIATSGYALADFSAPTDSTAYKRKNDPTDPATEAKFRTVCGAPSHFAYDDPLLYPGEKGKSHLHMFFGNTLTNWASTYRSLRTTGRSNCGGDVFNRTAYWIAALQVTVGGKRMVLRADQFIVYYKDDINRSNEFVDIPRDFGYVSGPDPMKGYVDPNLALIDQANAAAAAAGKPMRYTNEVGPSGRTNSGYLGVKCEFENGTGATATAPVPGNNRQPYLLDSQGRLTLDCKPKGPNGETGHIIAEFNAPTCWDGKNGHGGPTARGHVAMAMTATNIVTQETRTDQCFDGWYKIPHLEMTAFFPIIGSMANMAAMNPRWSSDDAPGYNYRAMESGHIDWFGAWDYGTEANKGAMLRWMRNCTGTMGSTPAECNYSTIDSTTRLLSDSPIPAGYKDPPGSNRNGRIVDNNHDFGTLGARALVPMPQGPHTIHAH